jgi:leucyl/phenylalanyl-tRNA--protein transferase
VYFLSQKIEFPDPSLAEPDGLLAVGGDLSLDRLVLAYEHSIFPWYMEDPILWFSPDPRMVLFPEKLKVSKSLRKTINKNKFEVTFNKDFSSVIRLCSRVHSEKGTWISEEMIKAYEIMHKEGYGISVEVWENGEIVGGLYGIAMGPVFCGESMFHLVPDASKVALVKLVEKMQSCGYLLLDAQVHTNNMERFGAEFISRQDYLAILHKETTCKRLDEYLT